MISLTSSLGGLSIPISSAVMTKIYSSSWRSMLPLLSASIMLKAVSLILLSLSLSFISSSHIDIFILLVINYIISNQIGIATNI